MVKTRTKIQVRSHAQKVFKKFAKEDLMIEEEDEDIHQKKIIISM